MDQKQTFALTDPAYSKFQYSRPSIFISFHKVHSQLEERVRTVSGNHNIHVIETGFIPGEIHAVATSDSKWFSNAKYS